MNPVKFASYIRTRTRTDSVTFNDATILSLANIVKDDIANRIVKADEDYFCIPLVRNLEAGKRNYAFEGEILNQIKRLQIKLKQDTIDQTYEYEIAKECDMNFLDIPYTESGITNYMSNFDKPKYDILGGELIILSSSAIENVTGGMKLYCFVYPEDITNMAETRDLSLGSSSIQFGIPRTFHKIWADKVVKLYKESQEKPLPLDDTDKNVEFMLNQAIASIKGMNLDREIIGTMPYNDGSQY